MIILKTQLPNLILGIFLRVREYKTISLILKKRKAKEIYKSKIASPA